MAPRSLPLCALSLCALSLGLVACPKPAADPGPDSTAKPGEGAPADHPELSVDFLRAHTKALSDDALGGRRPGSEGGAQAVAHIVETMEAIGLEPAGEDGGWTQSVGMRSVQVDREATTLELVPAKRKKKGKGKNEVTPFVFAEDWVGTSFNAGSEHAVDAELVFVGYGVTAPEYEWDDYADVDVKGKIVLAFVGDPPVDDGRFGGPAMTYYGRWTYKFERARSAGAAGCLVIHETAPASYGWNVPTTSYSGERFHVLGAGGVVPDSLGLQGWVSAEAADALAERLGSSLEAWHDAALKPDFEARATGLKLRGELHTTERRVEDVNVLGRLPGATQPDKAVVLTGHWDHLGTDPAKVEAGEDGIYNGAIDNASGIATMLGVAAALANEARAGAPLDRSVLFLATTAEEQGLLGSRYWVANPTVPLADLVAVINLDSMNVYGETRAVEVVGWGQSTLEDRLLAIAKTQGRSVVPDTHPEAGSFYRSDHFPFALAGVPAMYFHSSLDMVEGGREAGDAIGAGVRERYHTPADEFDESWSFAGTLQDAQLSAELVRQVASAEAEPRYKPESEFAGKR